MTGKHSKENPFGLSTFEFLRPDAPTFSAQLWIPRGAADDPESFNGLAHFCEHMAFRCWQGPEKVHDRAARLGLQLNALTAHDWTRFSVYGPGTLMEEGVALMHEFFGFDEPEF